MLHDWMAAAADSSEEIGYDAVVSGARGRAAYPCQPLRLDSISEEQARRFAPLPAATLQRRSRSCLLLPGVPAQRAAVELEVLAHRRTLGGRHP